MSQSSFTFPFNALGSPCELHLYAERETIARSAAEKAIADIRRIEARYSRYRADSFLSEINRTARAGGRIKVDAETAALLDYAQACYQQSDGLFDITAGILRQAWDFASGELPLQADIDALLPRIGWDKLEWNAPRLSFPVPGVELDFGGIGKEYAVDRAAVICVEAGIEHGLVELGGDIGVIGPHPDGSPWRVGIRHPFQKDGDMALIEVSKGAIASSGDYERCIRINGKRYGHILNPMTGWPVQGLVAVTVVSAHCLLAGSACTIAMLHGSAGPAWLADLGLPHLWMDDAGRKGGSLLESAKAPET